MESAYFFVFYFKFLIKKAFPVFRERLVNILQLHILLTLPGESWNDYEND